jgi:hypothetical protein
MKTMIDMAREAGLVCSFRPCSPWVEDYDLTPHLKAFEALVRADEREACAALADKLEWADNKGVASAIRARGNT